MGLLQPDLGLSSDLFLQGGGVDRAGTHDGCWRGNVGLAPIFSVFRT